MSVKSIIATVLMTCFTTGVVAGGDGRTGSGSVRDRLAVSLCAGLVGKMDESTTPSYFGALSLHPAAKRLIPLFKCGFHL